MTLFSPGQSPPQVTMAAAVRAGSKKIFSRGPAFSNRMLPGRSAARSSVMCSGMKCVSATNGLGWSGSTSRLGIGDGKVAGPSRSM